MAALSPSLCRALLVDISAFANSAYAPTADALQAAPLRPASVICFRDLSDLPLVAALASRLSNLSAPTYITAISLTRLPHMSAPTAATALSPRPHHNAPRSPRVGGETWVLQMIVDAQRRCFIEQVAAQT